MTKKCDGCDALKSQRAPENIPYIAHEAEVARIELHNKRLWIAIIILISLLFASHAGWLIYESQFDKISYEQDGDGINNVNYGSQGDLTNNESESSNQTP